MRGGDLCIDPKLDSIAEQGVRFTQFYVAVNVCGTANVAESE